jgi:beta-lactamase class D
MVPQLASGHGISGVTDQVNVMRQRQRFFSIAVGLLVCCVADIAQSASSGMWTSLTTNESASQSSESKMDLAETWEPREVALDSFFVAVEGPGTFVLVNDNTGELRIHNLERAGQRFLPASTFKIANTIIALETGVADGPDFTLSRDSTLAPVKPFWPRSWKQPEHTLRTAFRNSVYWYYQEIARRVGPSRMQHYLQQLRYGNESISPQADNFWLNGDLRISPMEQVEFLRKFYHELLGVTEETTEVVKAFMILEEEERYTLRGKTGTVAVTSTRELGWLVGYLERNDNVYFYALNMEGERVWEEWPPRKRQQLVLAILRQLGAL